LQIPVNADRHQVEYGSGTAHDIECHPSVAQSVAKLPISVVHLDHTHIQTANHPALDANRGQIQALHGVVDSLPVPSGLPFDEMDRHRTY